MKKIKTVKIKEIDGSIGEESYTITTDAKNVDMDNGKNVQETIGTININEDGNIVTQLKNKISKNNIVDNLESLDANKVLSANQGKILGDKINKKPYYYNSVADMKADAKLKAGDMAITLGYYEKNDGGNALYKIRIIVNTDVVDDMTIISLQDNTLIAELIYDNEINVLQIGLDPTNTNDNSIKLQSLINKLDNITLFFPIGSYKFTSEIDLDNKVINLKGNFNHIYGTTNLGLIFNNVDGFVNTGRIYIEQLIIQEKSLGHTSKGIKIKSGTRIKKCTIIGFNTAISCEYKPVVIEDCNLHYNNNGITNPVDSRIINNTINANELYGIMLQAGANDNIIDSNKIEWNKKYHILMHQCVHNVISNNIFDRSTEQALRMGEVSTTTITGNLFRRNNIATIDNVNNCQVRMESCHNIIFSSNQLLTGNSKDDGTGDTVPQYAMYIITSYDILSIGNSYVNSSVQSEHIKFYNNTGNVQFFDMSFDIPKLLTGSNYQGGLTTTNPLTLTVPGNPAQSNDYPNISKFNYYIRRTDAGAYEAGELYLYNFRLWNSETSTSAKMSINSFMNNKITAIITFDRETNMYNIIFTSTDGSYSIRLTPISI